MACLRPLFFAVFLFFFHLSGQDCGGIDSKKAVIVVLVVFKVMNFNEFSIASADLF